MASSHRVLCINKIPREDRHRAIQFIGGKNGDGTPWKLSQSQAIAEIEAGRYQFYVESSGYRADVIVATHNGHKYLKTNRDSTTQDNLLSLPECS